jgi:hypothetical protein
MASVVLAAVTAWGISYKWSPEHAAGLLGTITIGIPTLAVFGMGLWHWVIQFVSQETIYRATSDFGIAGQVLAQLQGVLPKPALASGAGYLSLPGEGATSRGGV